jgi:hypothetical protein
MVAGFSGLAIALGGGQGPGAATRPQTGWAGGSNTIPFGIIRNFQLAPKTVRPRSDDRGRAVTADAAGYFPVYGRGQTGVVPGAFHSWT